MAAVTATTIPISRRRCPIMSSPLRDPLADGGRDQPLLINRIPFLNRKTTGSRISLPGQFRRSAMPVGHVLSKASRNWILVVLAGVIGFATGAIGYLIYGAGWMVALLTNASPAVAATVMALPFGFCAAAIAGLFATARRRTRVRLLRAALNNMTQGLCMF